MSREPPPTFEDDVKSVDLELLAAAMGGSGLPPEEPLLLTYEAGFGYSPDAAVGRTLNHYLLARKVHV